MPTNHAEEILDVIFPARGKAAIDLQPGKQPLHRPPSPVPPQGPTVLRRLFAIAAMGRDHLNPIPFLHLPIQPVAVVSLVPDQSFGKFIEKAVPEGLFDELAFVRRSSLDTDGDRYTVANGDSRDLRPLASLGRTNSEAPFFAAANVASMKASSKFSRPSARNNFASFLSTFASAPQPTQC